MCKFGTLKLALVGPRCNRHKQIKLNTNVRNMIVLFLLLFIFVSGFAGVCEK
jgi:hypothetical protein